jgi:alkanesulfonate monooxygenase SsuD/methylene tetrahydromethanopterin reductase-like flavin-dependent oxidoreductase (luciferase family)
LARDTIRGQIRLRIGINPNQETVPMTILESLMTEAAAIGFDAAAVTDRSTNDRAQRAFIALTLFQIAQNTKRIAEATEFAANKMK